MFRCDPPLPALASDDARAVARAAFDLASARALGNEAALLRALRTWSTRGGNEAALVRLHLLDALVQGEAVVPAAAVLPHRSGPAAVAAFVLLARDAHLNELELLQSFRARVGHAADDLRWVAEGNLLCAMRTPGFAATLLRDIVWELTVVVESSARTGRFDPGACAIGYGGGTAASLAGFPPCPAYALQPAELGGEVLAPGTTSIAFVRRVGSGQPTGPGRHGCAPTFRLDWLHRLVGLDGTWVGPRVLVHTGTADELAAAMAWQRAEWLAARRRLLSALQANGCLAPHELVVAHKPLRMTIVDGRDDRSRPLPELGAA